MARVLGSFVRNKKAFGVKNTSAHGVCNTAQVGAETAEKRSKSANIYLLRRLQPSTMTIQIIRKAEQKAEALVGLLHSLTIQQQNHYLDTAHMQSEKGRERYREELSKTH